MIFSRIDVRRFNVTCLSISKDAGVVAHEGVVQQALPKALEYNILTCTKTRKQTLQVHIFTSWNHKLYLQNKIYRNRNTKPLSLGFFTDNCMTFSSFAFYGWQDSKLRIVMVGILFGFNTSVISIQMINTPHSVKNPQLFFSTPLQYTEPQNWTTCLTLHPAFQTIPFFELHK